MPTLRLTLDGHDRFVAFVDDPRAHRRIEVLEVEVLPWRPVRVGWSGRLGPLDDVRRLEVELDEEGGRGWLRLTTTAPVDAVQLVRAAYSVFYPVRRGEPVGGPRAGVQAGAPDDLAWRLGGGMRPVLPRRIGRREFIDFDHAATPEGLCRLDRATQTAHVIERASAPTILVNPKVHRPIDRLEPIPECVPVVARTVGDRFVVERHDGSSFLDVPLAEPLGAAHVRAFNAVRDVDASGVGADHHSASRLAEIAAHGQVVHGAPAGLPLHPELAALLAAPYGAPGFLDHMNRSAAQVRGVMRHHTRVLAAEAWPSVSVLLATRRPDLLVAILEQLAAQDHPDLEIVVGCHGFAAPEAETLSPRVRERLGPVLEIPADVVFGEVLARVTAAASGDLVTKVDDDDLYGPQHVADVMTAWLYSEAHLVGRKLALVRDEATDTLIVRQLFRESYRSKVAGGSMTLARHDLAAIGGWRPQARAVDRGLWTRLQDAGGLHYACSGPGYVHVRHQDHTWSVPAEHFTETYHVETLPGLPPAALGLLDPADLALPGPPVSAASSPAAPR